VTLLPCATVMVGVPTFYSRLLAQAGFNTAAAAGMRLFISGSAPLLAETNHEFSQRSGHVVLERYGMTESAIISSNPCSGERRYRCGRPNMTCSGSERSPSSTPRSLQRHRDRRLV